MKALLLLPHNTAVGVVMEDDGEIKFAGGPVQSVKAKTNAYVVVVLGDLRGKALFRRVFEVLLEKCLRNCVKRC